MAQDVMIDIYVASTCHLHSRCLLCPSVCRHFTIRGADDTEFAGGIYHGRILLPPEYPFKPPNIVFLTPSGRFEVGTKVCLSFSAHHPELWQPAWGIRLILEALISFLPTPADGAIGALDWTKEENMPKKNQINPELNHWPTFTSEDVTKSCAKMPEQKKRPKGPHDRRSREEEHMMEMRAKFIKTESFIDVGPKGTYAIREAEGLVHVVQYNYNEDNGEAEEGAGAGDPGNPEENDEDVDQ